MHGAISPLPNMSSLCGALNFTLLLLCPTAHLISKPPAATPLEFETFNVLIENTVAKHTL
jgi:hypothetical protein